MSLHGFHFEVKATRDEVNSKYFFFLQVSVASSLLFLRCGWSQRKTSQIILFGSNSVIFSVVNSVENEETAGSGSPTIVSAGSESSTISSSRDIRGKFCNIALHCNRNQMRWNHHERVRKRELKVRNAGNSGYTSRNITRAVWDLKAKSVMLDICVILSINECREMILFLKKLFFTARYESKNNSRCLGL